MTAIVLHWQRQRFLLWFTMDHCVCPMNVLHVTCWLCTAGGCGVFILHGVGWLYSIRRGTKCVVINFLLARTKLAIWFTRALSVCGSGAYWPTSLFILWPRRAKNFLYVGQGLCGMQLCMIVYVNVDYKCGYMGLQCLLWNIDLPLSTLEWFGKCNMILTAPRMICGHTKEEVHNDLHIITENPFSNFDDAPASSSMGFWQFCKPLGTKNLLITPG